MAFGCGHFLMMQLLNNKSLFAQNPRVANEFTGLKNHRCFLCVDKFWRLIQCISVAFWNNLFRSKCIDKHYLGTHTNVPARNHHKIYYSPFDRKVHVKSNRNDDKQRWESNAFDAELKSKRIVLAKCIRHTGASVYWNTQQENECFWERREGAHFCRRCVFVPVSFAIKLYGLEWSRKMKR